MHYFYTMWSASMYVYTKLENHLSNNYDKIHRLIYLGDKNLTTMLVLKKKNKKCNFIFAMLDTLCKIHYQQEAITLCLSVLYRILFSLKLTQFFSVSCSSVSWKLFQHLPTLSAIIQIFIHFKFFKLYKF